MGHAAEMGDLLAAGLGELDGVTLVRGRGLTVMGPDGARDVVFSVPEDKISAVKAGTDVAVRVWSDNRDVKGKVREVAAAADPVTRTFPIKVSLDAGANVSLGTTVYVSPQSLSMVGTPVIKLPTSALRKEGNGTAVWVLDKQTMTVKSQPVQIATADGNEAVIASGLLPGMLVVSAGVHVLSPGQKVAIFRERSAAPSNAVALDQAKTVAATEGAAPVAK